MNLTSFYFMDGVNHLYEFLEFPKTWFLSNKTILFLIFVEIWFSLFSYFLQLGISSSAEKRSQRKIFEKFYLNLSLLNTV